MKKILFTILLLSNFTQAQNKETANINTTLDAWHKAASMANFNDYMNVLTDDALYIGTDASENWNKTAFMAFAKPYFDKGKAWSFTALERHIYFDASGKTVWFDELLNTQMKICRGSGVLIKIGDNWKIKHYVLSMTIPNDNTDEVIKTKAPIEDKLIKDLTSKKN
jgi:ketosteroid isomerase-like protein